MSNALDRFGRALVNASRGLAADSTVPQIAGSSRRSPLRKLFGDPRRLSLGLQLLWAGVSLAAVGGAGAAAYLSLQGTERTTSLAAFYCNANKHDPWVDATNVGGQPAVTGNPIIDCAAVWPLLTGGKRLAPPLAAWERTSGKFIAVARPVSWGPPPHARANVPWRRLPPTWTVDLNVVELSDQLNDIRSGIGNGLTDVCISPSRATRFVQSLFTADRLTSWRVAVVAVPPNKSVEPACRPTTVKSINPDTRTVLLLQARVPTNWSAMRHLEETVARELLGGPTGTVISLETRLDRTLTTRCESVGAAAALWRAQARAAGLLPTNLAFFREFFSNHLPLTRNHTSTRRGYYTLVVQPASQHTGRCAHLLVISGAGSYFVLYAARIAP